MLQLESTLQVVLANSVLGPPLWLQDLYMPRGSSSKSF